MWYVYIIECSDGSFYTEITTNLARRASEHNNKKGAKSVRGKLPVRLIYYENTEDKILAAKREREIKGWTRSKKFELIGNLGK